MAREYFDTEIVDLGEPYGIIEVREMTGLEDEEYHEPGKVVRKENGDTEIVTGKAKRNQIMRVIADCCESESGMVIDVSFFGKIPRKRKEKIIDAFQRVNEIGKYAPKPKSEDETDDLGNSQTIQ